MAFDLDDEKYRATRKLNGVDKKEKEMTIQEAKEITKLAIENAEEHIRLYDEAFVNEEDIEAIKTVLTALNNSVSKDEIKEKIEEYHKFYVRNPEAYRKGNCRVAEVVLQELLNKGE